MSDSLYYKLMYVMYVIPVQPPCLLYNFHRRNREAVDQAVELKVDWTLGNR